MSFCDDFFWFGRCIYFIWCVDDDITEASGDLFVAGSFRVILEILSVILNFYVLIWLMKCDEAGI